MAVSAGYLTKMRRAIRRNPDVDTDAEITDLIEECRHDLIQLGVLETRVNDEADSLILGAIRSFVRWKFGLNTESAEPNKNDYMIQRDELRRRAFYTEAV